ncbi:hypothetical protein KGF57_000752 [Candida theae]|uniref:Carboxymuconolactone decarboxylase-like domain-containing protein n=1 Tax=Candida theae TaxID=1198502 RepID=A0AAD5BIC5_9ASCO|nr:uncharacterized protein KGF57_000752 [Candida theae]KAI5965486.1 hypothetical protein KGF57_000752 [Candida theae]
MALLDAKRLLRLAYHYPRLQNTWYLIATAALLELNLVEEIPAILHFALRQQLLEFSSDEDRVVNNEYMIKLANDSIESSRRSIKLNSIGVKVPDVLIPGTYYKLIPLNYKYTRGEDIQRKQQFIVKAMCEVILKLSALCGLPKAINGLTVLKAATPARFAQISTARPNEIKTTQDASNAKNTIDGPISSVSIDTARVKSNLLRGSSFWNTIFSNKINQRIRNQMVDAYPDLWYYTYQHIYSPLLSYTDILTAKKTSLVMIACLIPQHVEPQLKGHLTGAINNGASRGEISSTKELVSEICSWQEVPIAENVVAKL